MINNTFEQSLEHHEQISDYEREVFRKRSSSRQTCKLPDSLTDEDIKFGNPIIRNNQIVALSTHTLPFSGLGSGIKRAIAEQPNLELIDDPERELFNVIIPRPVKR